MVPVFKTPLPNPALWSGPTIGTLTNQDAIVNGGWWHDSRILAATGEGVEKEEPRRWVGWWNETVVELVELSMKQKDALCVLLTGRSERGFSDLVKRMVASKGLDFDMVGLKPAVSPTNQRFDSTMHFKQLFLSAMMETYKNAEEIRVYEDRPRHVKGFRDFFTEYNRRQNGVGGVPTRGPIVSEVIQVMDTSTTLDPVVEVAEVQHMINDHNETILKRPPHMRRQRLMIKKTVFFTGYMISQADTQRLLQLVQLPPASGQDLKLHANSILICPRPCPSSIMDKVGGMGAKMMWEVTGTACFDNNIWAACLRPVPTTAKFHTDNPSPFVVLALRKGTRPSDAGKIQNWQPVPPDKAYVIETTVGEKVILRIEQEDPKEDEYESLFANKTTKRKHTGDDEYPRTHAPPYGNGRNESRSFHTTSYHARGGSNQGRGGYRGNGTPNRGFRNSSRGSARGGGRGGRGGHGYRSLDDVEPRNSQSGYGQQVDYDDSHTPVQPSNQHAPQALQPPTQIQPQYAQYGAQQHGAPQYGAPQQPVYQAPYGVWPGQQPGQGTPQERPMGNGYGPGSDLQNYY